MSFITTNTPSMDRKTNYIISLVPKLTVVWRGGTLAAIDGHQSVTLSPSSV